MMKYILAAAFLALSSLAVLYYIETQKNASLEQDVKNLRIENATKTSAIERMEETARVHRLYLKQARKRAEDFQEIRNRIGELDGGDNELSPYLSGVARELYATD